MTQDDPWRTVRVSNDSGQSRSASGWFFDVVGWRERPTPRVLVFAGKIGGPEFESWLELGDTMLVGDETWRLCELYSPRGGRVHARLRLVDDRESQEPLVSDIFESAEFLPYGTLDRAQVSALEAELGQRLPSSYRAWLEMTNGAKPARPYKLGDLLLTLTGSTPLFGWHPEFLPYDLVTAQRRYRDVYFTPNVLVIGATAGAGGLLTVITGGGLGSNGSVAFLPGALMTGTMDPLEREKLMKPVGADITWFLSVLTPYEVPGATAGVLES